MKVLFAILDNFFLCVQRSDPFAWINNTKNSGKKIRDLKPGNCSRPNNDSILGNVHEFQSIIDQDKGINSWN